MMTVQSFRGFAASLAGSRFFNRARLDRVVQYIVGFYSLRKSFLPMEDVFSLPNPNLLGVSIHENLSGILARLLPNFSASFEEKSYEIVAYGRKFAIDQPIVRLRRPTTRRSICSGGDQDGHYMLWF